MPKMFGVFSSLATQSDRAFALESINLLGSLHVADLDVRDGFLAVSWLGNAPLKGARMYDSPDEAACFAGDVVGVDRVPWEDILSIVRTDTYGRLAGYSGSFAIAHYHKQKRRLTLLSDPRAQHPIYYAISGHGVAFSTEMSTFCRLMPDMSTFDARWLYDYFYFNYPVQQTTFLKDVHKMPPAAVLSYDFESRRIRHAAYCEPFHCTPVLLEQPQSFEVAFHTFQERVPHYFQGSEEIGCALTGGWDGRTMLAFAPQKESVTAFTYGVQGCRDLREAQATARKLGIKHKSIHFEQGFIERLPEYIVDAVFLSSGSEKALRATLKFVYEQLTTDGVAFPIVISGIGMDGIFRGHSMTPSIVSSDMAAIFHTGSTSIRGEFWSKVFADHYPEFEKNIHEKLEQLRDSFGDFVSPEHHLLYKLYVTHPELFGGELKIADYYTTLRVPAWDRQIVSLAFSIKESSLSFSEFTEHKRGDSAEIKLQSYLIKKCWPPMARIPIANTRPDITLRGRLCHEAYRVYRGVQKRINAFKTSSAPLENWTSWLNSTHREFVEEMIFSESALLRAYVDKGFLQKVRTERNMHWIGKLLTTEILLGLIKNRWKK